MPATAPRAAEPRNQPSRPNQTPETMSPREATYTPSPIMIQPNSSPSRPEKRVPRLRSPVTFQAIERAMRPPSSGNAGIRLKTSSVRLISASQPSRAMPGVVLTVWNVAVSIVLEKCEATDAAPRQTATMIAVTAGPAAATLNSSPGVSESRVSFATPPNSHRSMPAVPMPWRRATSAWPSSCSRSETKNSSVAATAVPNVTVLEEPVRTRSK